MTTQWSAGEMDEIDLRAWLQALVRSWKWIVGLTVLALVAAGGYTVLQPRLYEAAAILVAVPGSASDAQSVARTALEIASAESTIAEVYELARPQLHTVRDQNALGRAMQATAGRDPRILRLTVRTPDAAEAAAVANAWARLVVVRVNDVYLGRNPTPATALSQGASDLAEAPNPVILQAQRDAAQADVKNLQAAVYGLEGLERDIQAFRDRVARGDGESVSLEDQLTALFLQLRAFGVSAPERIEFGSDQLGALTRDRQALLARLDDLGRAVAARKADIQGRLVPKQAEVEALGRRMQAVEFKTGVGAVLSVGAPAVAPSRPAYPRPALNLTVAGALGLLVGLIGATAREALRAPIPAGPPVPVSEPSGGP